MKRAMSVGLSALVLNLVVAAIAQAANPPSGDANPSDLLNTTVDTTTIINPTPTAN